MTLTEFLRARLVEDEEAAVRAANYQPEDGHWSLRIEEANGDDDNYYAVETDDDEDGQRATPGPDTIMSGHITRDVEHDRAIYIACHDPARALREVEAKRWIIAQHPHTTYREHLGDSLNRTRGPSWERRNATILDRQYCETCHVDDGIIDGADGLPCRTLRMLAAVYADHSDYREDWTL